MPRLSKEREAEIREVMASEMQDEYYIFEGQYVRGEGDAVRELLAEIDALRLELISAYGQSICQDMPQEDECTINGVRLVLTCGACPEQYDAFIGEEKIAYLRLRHGHFTVDVPDVRGETIYEASPVGDGMFDSSERGRYLSEATMAINKWRINNKEGL